ncbi:MAG: amidohydrolase family protein [Bryobacteraceae bacterium]|nr:amidohydrolase family protein [Bryobacteraceae bacterium]
MRFERTMIVALACALLLAAASFAQEAPRREQAGPMDQLLLKDYKPEVSLVVPQTRVPKAKYAAIDVHSHAYMRTPEQIAAWVRTMDEAGVETTVILTGATGANFDKLAELFLKPYPDRFQLYCGIDTSNPETPDYPERAVAELVRCFRKGARGVGEVSDKGSGIARGQAVPPERRLHADDPRLDPFWAKCGELKLPVNLHIADHPSAWRPPDQRQERTPNFQRYNQWGRNVPGYDELLAKSERLLQKQPHTTFILCHLRNQGNDLAALAGILDRYPNLYVDISARHYEVGRQPRTAAKFLTKYSNRVLFGTDLSPTKEMYEGWWRLLETADEFIPGPNWWRHYGLELPDSALEPLYRGNAKRILNWQEVNIKASR